MNHFIADTNLASSGTVFPREDSCPTTTCPELNCTGTQICLTVTKVIGGKDVCNVNYCTDNPSPTPTQSASTSQTASSGTNIPAIAGGVVGGVVAMCIVGYLVWRLCIKNKRQPMDQEPWYDEKHRSGVDGDDDFAARRTNRSSTAHSVASTVLTRASNIIQIAYIPGVTNRATPTSPTLLVPPVPPIPIAVSQASTPATPDDQHFFMPSDLRPDSTYSAMTGYTDRTSYARTSYAPRSSIASTIYGKNAVIVAPAQTGMRAKPAMVSVKSTMSSGGSSGANTPPVPNIDFEKYGSVRPPSPANSTFSVGSTFLNNASAHTAMAARPQVVRVGSIKKSSPLGSSSGVDSSASTIALSRDSATVTIIDDSSPRLDQGPFADPSPSSGSNRSNKALSAVIQEATRRASQRYTASPTRNERESSPFGDEHATRDP